MLIEKIEMKCVYCSKTKSINDYQKREHVIPQCFGKFFPDNLILSETVCDDCNQYFGEKIELYFGRDSFEGIERLRHGIKPKKTLKHPRRVKSKIYEGEWKGVIVRERYQDQANGIGLEKVLQAGFYNKYTDGYDYFEPKDIPSAEELQKSGYDIKTKTVWLIAEEGKELNSLIDLLNKKGIKVSSSDKLSKKDRIGERFKVQTELTIDRIIFRGLSKIAFNYLCYIAGKEFLLNDDFNEIRQFIRYGEGKSDKFVEVNVPPILFDDQQLEKFRIKVTEGHLIIAGWKGMNLFSKVSLFNSNTFLANLCQSFKGIWRPIKSGHHFDVVSKKVSRLGSISKRFMI